MFRIDRRLIQNFDWVTFTAVIAIAVIGLLTIFSATRHPMAETQSPLFIKQLIWLLIGLLGMIIFVSFDYIWLSRIAVPAYVAGLLSLVAVLIAGRVGMGAQRWISIGPLAFQPSEFFKLIFIVMVSRYLCSLREPLRTRLLIKIFFVLVFLPFILLFKQPDLGTAIVVFMIFFLIVLAKGLQKKALALIVVIGLV